MKLISSEPDIRTLIERIDEEDIDLQPDFQRQEVWSVQKKKRLIDTVLRGWSIPPMHFVERADNRLEVLDGQQRLASLRDFVHNKFSIDGNVSPTDSAISKLHGQFYSQLDPATRRRFDQYPLRCFRITDYLPEEPNELFYRLNQPTMLTAGEQRNALFGPAREQLKRSVTKFEAAGNDKSTIGFSNARLAYDDVFARLFFFLEAGNFGVKGTEGLISERFRSKEPFSQQVEDKVLNSILFFSEARRDAPLYRFNKASILSWLLFLSRFDAAAPPKPGFMRKFIEAASGKEHANYIADAAHVFQDRSSLRVTDVSSVVYRDFVLCYVYYYSTSKELPEWVLREPIMEAHRRIAEGHTTFEIVLNRSLDINVWSATL